MYIFNPETYTHVYVCVYKQADFDYLSVTGISLMHLFSKNDFFLMFWFDK